MPHSCHVMGRKLPHVFQSQGELLSCWESRFFASSLFLFHVWADLHSLLESVSSYWISHFKVTILSFMAVCEKMCDRMFSIRTDKQEESSLLGQKSQFYYYDAPGQGQLDVSWVSGISIYKMKRLKGIISKVPSSSPSDMKCT